SGYRVETVGVVNGSPYLGQIAAKHGCTGAVSSLGKSRDLSKPLIEGMKPYLVLPEWATHCSAELVALQVFRLWREEAPGVQNLVAQEFKSLTMELVSASPGSDVNSRRLRALIGQKEVLLYFELIDGGDGEIEREFTVAQATDADPVDGVADRIGK